MNRSSGAFLADELNACHQSPTRTGDTAKARDGLGRGYLTALLDSDELREELRLSRLKKILSNKNSNLGYRRWDSNPHILTDNGL